MLDAERDFYTQMNANPLRGLYSLSVRATSEIAAVRRQIAELIGAVDEAGKPASNDIVFTRNTSESLNLVAKSFAPCVLGAGDEVAVTIMEHHSDLIPWQQACRAAGATLVLLYPDDQGVIRDEEIAAKIGPKTRIVAVTEVSNVLGVRNPVEKIAEAAHAQGAYVVVDGAQSVPHMAVDVRELGADFLAFSAHKALGPMGIGVLWGRHELLDAMPPMLTGGEMIDSVTEQDATWAPVPEKFEAGTQDAAGIYATGAALTYLTRTGGLRRSGRPRVRARRPPHGRAWPSSTSSTSSGTADASAAPRRRELQRPRRPPARRGEHPRRVRRMHPRGPPLRPAPAHLARRGEPRLLPRQRGLLQRQVRRRSPDRRPRASLAGIPWP